MIIEVLSDFTGGDNDSCGGCVSKDVRVARATVEPRVM